MAVQINAIQMRRGAYADFDPSKLVAGELAVVLSGDTDVSDGKSMYVCFAAGDVKRVATWEDAAELIAEQLPEAFDLAVSSATTDAITVAHGDSASAFTVSHVAKFSEAEAGLDPYSSSAGDATTLGTTTLVDGTTFFVPCVSVDTYGHVTGIAYRRFSMPTTGIATLTRLGKVIPDGSTITVDANGMISTVGLDGALVYKGVLDSADDLPESPSNGDFYIVDGASMFWDEDNDTWQTVAPDLSDYVTQTALTTTLANYPTETELATTLADYVQATDLVAMTDAEIHAITGIDGYADGDEVSY